MNFCKFRKGDPRGHPLFFDPLFARNMLSSANGFDNIAWLHGGRAYHAGISTAIDQGHRDKIHERYFASDVYRDLHRHCLMAGLRDTDRFPADNPGQPGYINNRRRDSDIQAQV